VARASSEASVTLRGSSEASVNLQGFGRRPPRIPTGGMGQRLGLVAVGDRRDELVVLHPSLLEAGPTQSA
jgi:hypothetical protein